LFKFILVTKVGRKCITAYWRYRAKNPENGIFSILLFCHVVTLTFDLLTPMLISPSLPQDALVTKDW